MCLGPWTHVSLAVQESLRSMSQINNLRLSAVPKIPTERWLNQLSNKETE